MEKILEQRKELLEQYEKLNNQIIELDLRVYESENNKSVDYETKRLKLEHEQDKIVLKLIKTEKSVLEQNYVLALSLRDNLRDLSKATNQQKENLIFAEERVKAFNDLIRRFDSVIYCNDNDLYEIDICIADLKRIQGDEDKKREELTNISILRNLYRPWPLSEEADNFKMLLSAHKNLTEKLKGLSIDSEQKME